MISALLLISYHSILGVISPLPLVFLLGEMYCHAHIHLVTSLSLNIAITNSATTFIRMLFLYASNLVANCPDNLISGITFTIGNALNLALTCMLVHPKHSELADLNFCLGISHECSRKLYQNSEHNYSREGSLIVLSGLVTFTFFAFVAFLIEQSVHDNLSLRHVLRTTAKQRRNKKNAVTFFGHMLGTMLLFVVLILIAIFFWVHELDVEITTPFVSVALSSIYPLCQALVVPELRRKMADSLGWR